MLKSDVKVKDWLGSEGEVLCPRIRGSMRRTAGPFHTLFRSRGQVGRGKGGLTGSCSQKRETRL